MFSVFHRSIEHELKTGNCPQRKTRRKLPAYEAICVLQRLDCCVAFFLATEDADEHTRKTHIGRDFDPQNAGESESRILQLLLDDLAQFFAKN